MVTTRLPVKAGLLMAASVLAMTGCASHGNGRHQYGRAAADLLREQARNRPTVPAPAPAAPVEIARTSTPAPPRPEPMMMPGSGVFARDAGPDGAAAPRLAAAAQPAIRPAALRESGDEISVNFVDADIREVVRSVIASTGGAPVLIDPKVQGQVTLQTSRPIRRSDALAMLEGALRVNGAALVETGGNYSVVPLQDAPKAAGITRFSLPDQDPAQGFGVHIVPLRHISAPEMAKILQPFIPAERIVRADASRPILIVAATRQEIATLNDLVNTFDVDWLRGMSFGMFPLENVKPSDLAKDLEAVFPGGPDGALAGQIRFVPVDRMNSLLVITQRADYLTKVRTWVQQLDRSRAADVPRVYVYNLQNASAENLAATLGDVFSTGGGRSGSGGDLAPGLRQSDLSNRGSGGFGNRGNGFGGSGNGFGSGGGFGSGNGFGGNRSSSFGSPAAYSPAYGPAAYGQALRNRIWDGGYQLAADAPPVPLGIEPPPATGRQAAPGSARSGDGPQTPDIRIIADRDRNALLIFATPNQYQMVEDAVRRLDTAPMQVLVEATIAEVTLNDQLNYGVEWFFKQHGSQFQLTDPTLGGIIGPAPGFSYLLSTASNIKVVLNALSSITNVDVLSSPQLLVLDNQVARLQVGDQVPIATQSAVSSVNPDAPIVNTISFRDTGVILEVRPRITSGGQVVLEVNQEVSDVVPTKTSGIDSPTIQQRNVHSTVAVQSGRSVALGGLIRNSYKDSHSGIPILSDIPILGALFSSTDVTQARTELLIMLTPRVIRNPAEAQQATDDLRRRMQSMDPGDPIGTVAPTAPTPLPAPGRPVR